ncbi:hypothetical protein SODG_005362 [Sodalis praecaptivus]
MCFMIAESGQLSLLWLAPRQYAGNGQRQHRGQQRRFKAPGQPGGYRGQHGARQLPLGIAAGQQTRHVAQVVRRLSAATFKRELHDAEKAAAGQQRADNQATDTGQANHQQNPETLRPQRQRQAAAGGQPVTGEDTEYDAGDAGGAKYRPYPLAKGAAGKALRRHLR